jgi:CRISPR-associated protein Cmr2
MNFDLHSWAATEVKEGRKVAVTPSNASASAGIAATSAGLFAVLNDKVKREEQREAWRRSVRLPDHSEFQKIYDPCWGLPEAIELFPPYTFLIRLRFKLASALLTKDDQEYNAIDNPVRKDRTFGVPYLSACSWKGCFRAALARLDHAPEDETAVRLCGNVRGEEDYAKSRRGRLEFFATPFEGIGFEVLNPHDRKSKTGKPVYYECVPAATTGEFCLLYVPFDGFTREAGDLTREVCADLLIVAETLGEMLLVSGFGAKVSSGYGLAQEQVRGQMRLRAALRSSPMPAAAPPIEPLAGYLLAPRRLRPEYLNPDGTFRRRDAATMKKRDQQQYEKALKWYEARMSEKEQTEPKPKVEPVAVQVAQRPLNTLRDVITIAQDWSRELQKFS